MDAQNASQFSDTLDILGYLNKSPKSPTMIGLCLKRNINLVVGLFGTLKAGAVFLPLDPKEPETRLKFMIQDAKTSLILTDKETLLAHPWLTEFPNIILNDLETIDTFYSCPDIGAENFMYLIYTSGTTGKPKGVLCQHQAVINRFEWLWKNYPYSQNDICCQKAPIGYVDSIWELICPLLKGIPYHIISDEILFNPIKLLDYLSYHKITRIELVPSLLEILLQEISERNYQLFHLNFWVVSGDIVRPALVHAFKKLLPNSILLNRFGSTEATSYLWYRAHLWNEDSLNVPIGKPVDNVETYILDNNLQSVPTGEVGELYVSGLSLSHSYLNDPELTEKKFIDNPFTKSNEQFSRHYARMYKTGDLVRELSSGDIEYIGRADHQIKIHGFRIEPLEIEKSLEEYFSIKEAKVILQTLNDESYLTAYYILKEGHHYINNEAVKKHLEKKLPPYLIPNFYVCLERFPLNKNGKLDRLALPKPNFHEHADIYEDALTNTLENLLIAIWESVLHIENVKLHDNFFSLGGHSLLAMKIIAEIYNTLSIALNITDIWQYPTIQELASRIQSLKNLSEEKIEEYSDSQHLPLSSIEQELWFLYKFERAKESSYHVHLAVELSGDLNCHAIKASINYLVKHHSILRTAYLSGAGGLYRKILDYNEFEVPIICVLKEEIERTVEKYIAIPFDMESGHLFRAIIFKLSRYKHVLLIVQHHIISDDGALEILLSELSVLYKQYINDQLLHLPISKPYFEFALWQKKQVSNHRYEKQLNFWKNKLIDTEPLNLITDFQKTDLRTNDGDIYRFSIERENSSKLQAISRKMHVSLFISLLAVVNILIGRYAKQKDILIGVPVSLRDNPLFYNVIGLLLNIIIVKVKLNDSLTFLDLLNSVKSTVTESFENKDLPFNILLKELNIEITPGISPLFNVLFVYQDTKFIRKFELEDIETKFLDIHNRKSKYDLTFYFEKAEDKIIGKIEYNSNLFRQESIARMGKSFNNLLTRILNNPEKPIIIHSLLDEVDYKKIIHQWNKTQTPTINYKGIHNAFEKQVIISPHAIAIQYQNQTITYEALNNLANQIARVLISNLEENKARKKETLIAVCLERNPTTIATLLAIFKANCGYIPIDTSWPLDRIKDIIQQSQPEIVIFPHYNGHQFVKL